MNPRVKDVKSSVDYTLTILFDNGERKVFDVKPYLDKGIFRELKDPKVFNAVRPFWEALSGPTVRIFVQTRFIWKRWH